MKLWFFENNSLKGETVLNLEPLRVLESFTTLGNKFSKNRKISNAIQKWQQRRGNIFKQ